MLKFPKDFKWGTATAAFQIEGHPDEYSQKLSDWSTWLDDETRVIQPSNSGRAVDHWSHAKEDIQLIKGLNTNSYRFSFNWAAIHRGPDLFDEETLKFYEQLLEKLTSTKDGLQAVEPFATLVHFVLPKWLSDQGGWENPNTAYEFANFTKVLVKRFGKYIKNWITHNEPNIFLWFGYESGIWCPGYQNAWDQYLKAFQGILLGHQLAYKTIKEIDASAQVGYAQNMYAFHTLNKAEDLLEMQSNRELSLEERIHNLRNYNTQKQAWHNSAIVPTIMRNKLHNMLFIEAFQEMGAMDFLGVNYYSRLTYDLNSEAKDPVNPNQKSDIWSESISLKEKYPKQIQTNNLGWEIYPEGLYEILTDQKLKSVIGDIPIYITENGYCHVEDESWIANLSPADKNHDENPKAANKQDQQNCNSNQKDINDQYRIDFLNSHLTAIHKAIEDGANIQGYFYWSLLDNFEWAMGMSPRFGLIHVDHDSFERKPKDSYHHYAEICKQNSI